MANIAIRFILGAAWLPVAAMAQAQAPLTGSMASPVVTQAPDGTTSGAAAAAPQAQAMPSTGSATTPHARNFAATWAVEVPMNGQAPHTAATSSAVRAAPTAPAYPSSSSVQAYPVAAAPNASARQHAPQAQAAPSVVTNTSSADASYMSNVSSSSNHTPPHRIGDDTGALFAEQANGTYAGHTPGMLGAAASLSYQRYLDSFKQPIPQWFKEAVKTDGAGGN
jgi:hypothetical protein